MILTHGANSLGAGGPIIPPEYERIEKISIPYNKVFGGVLLDVNTNNAAVVEVDCFIDYSLTYSGILYILVLYNGSTEKGGVHYKFLTHELYGSNKNTSFVNLGNLTESVYSLKLNKDKLSVNDSVRSIAYSKQDITAVSLGCANSSGKRSCPYDVFGVTITDEDSNIILNGIPVKRTLDDATGIYDIVSQQFFINNV